MRESSRQADNMFGTNLDQNFEGNVKMFWKEVKSVLKAVRGEG